MDPDLQVSRNKVYKNGTEDNVLTTARSKNFMKGGSGHQINGIPIEPLSSQRTLVKNMTEKDGIKLWNSDQLTIDEMPGKRFFRLQSIRQAEKEMSILSSETAEQINISKTHQTYDRMKNSKFLLKYEHKSEPSQSLESSGDEFDEIATIGLFSLSKKKLLKRHGDELFVPENRSWILRESGFIRQTWDISVIFFAIYNSILTPFVIAFDPVWQSDIYIIWIDWIIYVFFFVDIGINFRTTYTNIKTGLEVWEPKLIAKNYLLGGKFIVDFLSSIPFNYIPAKSIAFLNAIGMLKIVRISRISKIIQHLNVTKEIKTVLKTLQLLFNLLLYIHLLAWVWWIVLKVEETWVPTMDYIFYSTTLYNESLWYQYWSMMYHSVMLFGVNEMASRTTFVLISSSFIMLFSAMVKANIIGQVAVLIGDMSIKMVKFQKQVDTVNTAMVNMGINGDCRHLVREYLLNTQATQDQQEELNHFLKNISPSLRFKVLVHIFSEVMKSNFVFSYLITENSEDTIIPYMVQKLDILLTIPETEIVKQGEDPFANNQEPKLYFVAKGEWEVLVRILDDNTPIKSNKLRIGDHFGEISILYNWRRTASVMSTKYATIGWLSLAKYREVLFKYQEISDKFFEQIYEYNDSLKLFKENRLKEIPYLKHLSKPSIHEVIFKLKIATYEKGNILLQEDTIVDQMIIIQDGLVDVEVIIDKKIFVLESLPRGAILNYHRFLLNRKFKIIARWKTTTSLLFLTSEDFFELMENNEEIYNHYIEYENKFDSDMDTKTLLLDFRAPISINEDHDLSHRK